MTDPLYQYYQAANLSPLWPEEETAVKTIEAGSQSAGELVIFQTKWQANRITDCRYRIQGCGYLIASIVYLSQWLIDKSPQQISQFNLETLITHFNMPKHKYHVAQLIHQIVLRLA